MSPGTVGTTLSTQARTSVALESSRARAAARSFDVSSIAGLEVLQAKSSGDPRICVAVLDGPVDRSHAAFRGANLQQLETLVPASASRGPASRHGTHVASVIFGQPGGLVRGIAPHCRGLVVPIFTDGVGGSIAPCSQLDLARAILQAAQHGAHVINISGGELAPSSSAHPLLADAVSYCARQGILIVAAAGNQGCDCLHVPGSLPQALAVGAMDARGEPLESSNWGEAYQAQGVLAPGEDIPGASPGCGTAVQSGTSFAAAVVSGIAALLLSVQLKHGREPDPEAVRQAILQSAAGSGPRVATNRRLLAGRLNITGAIDLITRGVHTMSDSVAVEENGHPSVAEDVGSGSQSMPDRATPELGLSDDRSAAALARAGPVAVRAPTQVVEREPADSPRSKPTGCGCAACAPPQLVYALGQLGYDFGTEARRDSIMQHMGPAANPHDPVQLLAYLKENPWDAASIIWTLNLDATPIYAVQPGGPFAREISERLCSFLGQQLHEGVERVSIPGRAAGKATLLNGQVVPAILPELRGMYSWTTGALVQAICGSPPARPGRNGQRAYTQKLQGVGNFLERVYFESRNLGVTSQERALNYAATNALNIAGVYEEAMKEQMDLDTIDVERSPVCRPDSDCWDVKLLFFYPQRQVQTVRKAYRFTVDVSDLVPVMVGKVRSWFVR